MRKLVLIAQIAAVVALLTAMVPTTALAAEKPATDSLDRYLGLTYRLDYNTQWISKGAQGYGKQGAVFNTIDLDLYQTGFGFKVTHRNATHDGYVDKQRFDYRPSYTNSAFVGQRHQIDYQVSVGYEHYYGLTRHEANTTLEWIFGFRFPNICPFGSIPYYVAHYETPVSGGDVNRKVAGWVHRFGVDLPLKNLDLPIPLTLNLEAGHYDGLGNNGHDWGYAHIGLMSKINICKNVDFVPKVYQQISLDDQVNKNKDVTYGIFSLVVRCK